MQELRAGVARRGFHISDALLWSTFDSADMDNNHTIDFKVCGSKPCHDIIFV